jgi:hypothetical protein
MYATVRRQSGWLPDTEEDRDAVLRQLDVLLKSSHFRNSKRYTAFLEYVVRETLSGNGDSLKERTLGIEVFNRATDYDTNSDPIVRVTAGEIRKRLALCYREQPDFGIRIDLPAGSYVPVLRRVPTQDEQAESGLPMVLDGDSSGDTVAPHSTIPLLETGGVDVPAPERWSGEAVSRLGVVSRIRQSVWGGFRWWVLASGAVLVTALVLGATLRGSKGADPVAQLWQPVFANQLDVMVVVGQPHLTGANADGAEDVFSRQHQPENEIFLSSGITIGHICSVLGAHPFQIAPARSTPISDLRKHPVVLIGAFNNPWTLRLLKPLRFSLAIKGDGDSTVSPQVLEIVDAKAQSGSPWTVDTHESIATMAHDYAIVARFQDETTEGPVVVAAGMGSTGTESAGEFLTSRVYLHELAARAPRNWAGQNMEAVIETDIIDGRAGHPHIVTAEFW